MRATARALYDERSGYESSLMNEADLGRTQWEMRIHQRLRLLPAPTTPIEHIRGIGRYLLLWMREFYLELCKRVQFPLRCPYRSAHRARTIHWQRPSNADAINTIRCL